MVGTYSRVPSTFCLMLRFFFLFNAQIFCLLYTAMQNFSSMDTISHLAKKNGQMDVALFSGQHSGGSTFKSPTRLRCVSVLLSFSFIVQSLRPPCEWCKFGQVYQPQKGNCCESIFSLRANVIFHLSPPFFLRHRQGTIEHTSLPTNCDHHGTIDVSFGGASKLKKHIHTTVVDAKTQLG